jgi:hypothetical protein
MILIVEKSVKHRRMILNFSIVKEDQTVTIFIKIQNFLMQFFSIKVIHKMIHLSTNRRIYFVYN